VEEEAVRADEIELDVKQRSFLTNCESGQVAEATWTGIPPNHDSYKKEQNNLRIRREKQRREHVKQTAEVAQDHANQTPPRRVVLEETIRNTPPQERLGRRRSEIRREKQQREHVKQTAEVAQDDANQTPPRRVVLEETIRNTPPQERLGLRRSEIRENQRTKPPKERIGYIKRDSTRSRQTLLRAAKSTPAHAGEDYSTDSEEEYKESPGNKE
jgi:hypothetical protein